MHLLWILQTSSSLRLGWVSAPLSVHARNLALYARSVTPTKAHSFVTAWFVGRDVTALYFLGRSRPTSGGRQFAVVNHHGNASGSLFSRNRRRTELHACRSTLQSLAAVAHACDQAT